MTANLGFEPFRGLMGAVNHCSLLQLARLGARREAISCGTFPG